ncbi:hypothetical protein FDG50_12625 [Clostridium botulinum]|uniref:hypothetical protein n=1 Tax=Clostridium botulinum TaxID=1491 RepID=UPI001400AEB4|nr:hypothetical protein [Clostridium botulinum]MBY6837968.1 hypothetical protein [Clostridium botulinum]NFG63806.1 hypothetical protein [Clostridium botulinum]NFQ24953.1 hypothetical protein [Clostridium botulinum]
MRIKTTDFKFDYTRYIEGMGKGLVLFKVKANKKAIGQNYHYFYEDKKKPPLDITVNPKNKMIEYVSFFAQDEKIGQMSLNLNITFDCFNIDANPPEEKIMKNFILNFNDNNLYLLDSEASQYLIGYEINIDNHILFDQDNIFRGILLSNISDEEIKDMRQSAVL